MRDLPEFADKPSVADANIERLAALWDFAEEFLHLPDMRAHKGINPARNIKKLKTGEAESAPLWPLQLCRKFETYQHPELLTFYYLARYTGQRRSDLVNMQWDHIDEIRNEMFVAQIKTGARIWVPMPKPLRDYLENWPRRGLYIVMSTKTLGAPWRETSLERRRARDHPCVFRITRAGAKRAAHASDVPMLPPPRRHRAEDRRGAGPHRVRPQRCRLVEPVPLCISENRAR